MRAVLDANVLISAVLSRTGPPAQLLSRWLAGEFELVVSGALLAELERALGYPKLRARVSAADAAEYVGFLRQRAVMVADPATAPARSADPGDDYLLALAEVAHAVLVSGDKHLLALAGDLPVIAPADFLRTLG